MLSQQDFIRIITLEYNVVKRETEGLSHQDALIQPETGGNCMNWILGHLVDNQLNVLKLLNQAPPIKQEELSNYQRESEPITEDGPHVIPLERLLQYHKLVHEAVISCLEVVDEKDFQRKIQHRDEEVSVGWRFLFLHFHFTYHLGQLEHLRRLAGK